MDRRTFLKAAGLGSISFAYGCNQSQNKNLFSLVQAPEDMVTGQAAWYASTCTECPAGCGILAKNREGRIVKLEGNPLHPVNRGKLCIRGQSALQAIYDPDRLVKPKLRVNGEFREIGFDEARKILKEKIELARSAGRDRIRMISGMVGDPLQKLFENSLSDWNARPPVLYEPFSHDALKSAYAALFNRKQLPSYHMEKTDMILSFGADFLETWLSPVEYARKFKEMHGYDHGKKGRFIHVGPYMSLTAANADKYLCCQPGTEVVVVMGIISELLKSGSYDELPKPFVDQLRSLSSAYDQAKIEAEAGVAQADLSMLVNQLKNAKQPLVLGGVSPAETSYSLELAVAMLNLLLDSRFSLADFENRHALEKVAPVNEVIRYLEAATDTPTDLLLFYQCNPVFTLPADEKLEALYSDSRIFKVVFSNFMDDTAARADLVFPTKLYLETWDALEGKTGMISTLQPAMGRLTDAPPVGDLFLSLMPTPRYADFQHFLMDTLYPSVNLDSEQPWLEMIQVGGRFEGAKESTAPDLVIASAAVGELRTALKERPTFQTGTMTFMAVPSLRYFDGRGANKSWVSEIPDPVTNIAWESMAMVHPDTLKQKGWKQGDKLQLKTVKGTIEAPIYSYHGVCPDLIVMQTGMGHANYGRFAQGFGSNPMALLDVNTESVTAAVSYLTALSAAKKVGKSRKLPKTDGSRSQYERKIAESEFVGRKADDHHAKEGLTMNTFPLTLPIEEGYSKKRDVYRPHKHDGYRWGMIVDLDRCIGCSACSAACYAENNLGVVGKEQVIKGREMSWLRIERYEDKNDKKRLIFLPMLCQHCDNAPCEAVCPVYAPYHGKEGLNNQIYNRCIGTRFCAQNCPYKVRRFNWHTWEWPKPLNLQLNPNVTVRSKGVMEKCSFCVQRIKEAHNNAKNENRKIRDGEVQPACVQTCPTDALVFGNFMDKNSRIYQLAKDHRAYQVLGYLNTKPAVVYLKKILQKV